ncbi:MAG: hypothetical protein CMA86_05590 [Euryarchaeota archaeon]|nr:hypothetical protein [Euryarchaeota archaeon]
MLDENNQPLVNLTDSVQVGHNAIGPSTGDIVINAGTEVEHCSMCKTPIDAVSNPGLYCFKEGCNTMFCTNCESFFRASRKPGEKPYCSEHISEFQGAASETVSKKPDISPTLKSPNQPLPSQPPQAQPRPAPDIRPPVPTVVGVISPPVQTPNTQMFVPFQQQSPRQVVQQMVGNPYLHQTMVHPWTAVVRTLKNWNGQGRAQRSEYWFGFYLYLFILSSTFFVLALPVAFSDIGVASGIWLFVVIATTCVFLIPLLSLQIRRLHDIGASGWWVLLWVFAPYIGPMILLCMALLPGQPHPNKYD